MLRPSYDYLRLTQTAIYDTLISTYDQSFNVHLWGATRKTVACGASPPPKKGSSNTTHSSNTMQFHPKVMPKVSKQVR